MSDSKTDMRMALEGLTSEERARFPADLLPEELRDEEEAPPEDAEVEVPTPEPPTELGQLDLRPKPRLDLEFVRVEIAAGRTPTCPDCGEALTKVPKPGARFPRGWVAPDPEAHRCDPGCLARLARARAFVTRPGETPLEARRRRAAGTETYIRPAPEEAELF